MIKFKDILQESIIREINPNDIDDAWNTFQDYGADNSRKEEFYSQCNKGIVKNVNMEWLKTHMKGTGASWRWTTHRIDYSVERKYTTEPIIVLIANKEKCLVLDGTHRITKRIKLGLKTIPVLFVRFPQFNISTIPR